MLTEEDLSDRKLGYIFLIWAKHKLLPSGINNRVGGTLESYVTEILPDQAMQAVYADVSLAGIVAL